MPFGTSIQASHTCGLLLTDLPPQSRKAHVLPGLVHNSLTYVGKSCYSGCDVTLKKEEVYVMKDRKCVMLGSLDPRSGIWRVDLTKTILAIQSVCNHAHDTSYQKEYIRMFPTPTFLLQQPRHQHFGKHQTPPGGHQQQRMEQQPKSAQRATFGKRMLKPTGLIPPSSKH
jgi:hypothetical protein